MNDKLLVTLSGEDEGVKGVPLYAFLASLNGVQEALRLMVEHVGGRPTRRGRPPRWVEEQSQLRIIATRSGSLTAELNLAAHPSGQEPPEDYGKQAIERLLQSGEEGSPELPRPVANRLRSITSHLPAGYEFWLGNDGNPRMIGFRGIERNRKTQSTSEEAHVSGWLKEVNWDKRTAQLHRFNGPYIRLRFTSELDAEMKSHATDFVEIIGRGSINDADEWKSVLIDEILPPDSWENPLDLEAFLNDPNPKRFDPDKLITASEPFDVDEFLRVIYEGRKSRAEGFREHSGTPTHHVPASTPTMNRASPPTALTASQTHPC